MIEKDLSLVFLAGDQVEPELKIFYNETYRHWESVWSDTFKEINGKRKFFSDNFTRQDEIMALFHKDRCISVCCHRLADMSMPSLPKDSYFQAWPEAVLLKIKERGGPLVIDNQISVDPDFRKSQTGHRISDLMAFLSLRHLMPLNISGVLGASRNSRAMDELFERFNPVKLDTVIFHGEVTSLYIWTQEQITFERFKPEIGNLADDLLIKSKRSQFIHPTFSKMTGGQYDKKAA